MTQSFCLDGRDQSGSKHAQHISFPPQLQAPTNGCIASGAGFSPAEFHRVRRYRLVLMNASSSIMTLTETLSYLRSIGEDWGSTAIPADKVAALEAACLIETQDRNPNTVRLTPTGKRCKAIAESHHVTRDTTPSRSSTWNSTPRHHRAKRSYRPAPQLV